MKVYLAMVVFALSVVGCSKDKFQTKPRVEINSDVPDILGIGQDLQLSLEFFDKEGDVDTVFIERRRVNRRAPLINNPRTFDRKIPSYPSKDQGFIDLNLDYTNYLTVGNTVIPLPGSRAEPDTLALRFYVKDKQGNTSDTVALDKNVVVIR